MRLRPRPGDATPLLATLAVAVALRAWWLVTLPRDVGRDGATYARLAESLASGLGYRDLTGSLHSIFPPGYPAATAAVVLLGAGPEYAARLVSLVAGMGVVVVTYAIARRLFAERAALFAALLTATNGRLVDLPCRSSASRSTRSCCTRCRGP